MTCSYIILSKEQKSLQKFKFTDVKSEYKSRKSKVIPIHVDEG